MNNNKYIPLLRFPEFQNEGYWELRSLAEILNYEQPGAYIVNDTNYKKTGTPVLTANKGFILGYTDESYGVYNDLPVIIFDDFTTDKKFVNFPFKVKSSAIKLLTLKNKNRDDLKFIFECMKNIKFEEKEHKRYYISTYQNIKILVPKSTQEQKKIADCFVSIDKEIDATKRKLEQLKEHKKGLMQRLFPAKGKTIPELRFPEFQNDGEWVEVSFGSIINVNSGKDYKHLDIGNIPVYGTGGYMLSVNDKLSDIDAVGIGRKGTIDKPQYLKAPFWTVDTLFFLTSSKNYDIRYLYYLCQTIPWKTYGEQTGVPSISKNSIDKLDVVITTNLTEQQKIAQSLLHLDNAMDAIEKKIHLLETHKYGLMQNLFPNLNNY